MKTLHPPYDHLLVRPVGEKETVLLGRTIPDTARKPQGALDAKVGDEIFSWKYSRLG